MNGRDENTLKIEGKIERDLLPQMPEVVSDYYYSLTDATAKTKNAYIRHIGEYLKYLNKNYLEATQTDINKYMKSIQYREIEGNVVQNSESIRATKFYAISSFYRYLYGTGIISYNPCECIKPPTCRIDKPIVYLTPEEIEIIKTNIRNGNGTELSNKRRSVWASRDLAIVTLGVSTGLRVSAISQINIDDINFEDRSIHVIEKGNVSKYVYFGENTSLVLSKWIDDRNRLMCEHDNCAALFISDRRKRINTETIRLMVRKYSAGINKHITPHKMRDTYATNLYQKTGDIYLVADGLGHRNLRNTQKYTKINDEKKRNAAEIMDMI